MTSLSDLAPPAWAWPLYGFELGCWVTILFQMWLFWPLIKESVNERLGRAPATAKAPPVGQ